jgi:putative tryptophan/tyrosine transport system substrate-binding protein
VRRRDFIAGLGSAVAWPLAGHAQEGPSLPVIGILSPGTYYDMSLVMPLILSGLNERGYFEGRNVVLEYRFAEGQYERMPTLVSDLARLRAAVVIAYTGTVAVPAMLAGSPQTPIVFISGVDPVQAGVVPRLSRPGGNMTGIVTLVSNIGAKQLEILHELLPKAVRAAALVNPANPGANVWARDTADAARMLGLEFMILNAVNAAEIEAAFMRLLQVHSEALLVAPDPFFYSQVDQIVELEARHGVPVMYAGSAFSKAGGLTSYTSNSDDLFRIVGVYVARILQGEKASDLPVQQPTRFRFAINLRTAKLLGIEVPPRLLALADEVIE